MHRRRTLISSLLALSALTAVLVAPGATLAASPASTTAATPTTSSCPATHWPVAFAGVPTRLHAGASGGDYLWHDSRGWHLRVTHAGHGRVAFSGSIVASAPISVTPARLEKGDVWALSADKKTLTYRFQNYGYVDGLDLHTACAQRLTIRGAMSGHALPTARIWVGHDNRHPLSNRFVVVKVR